MVTPPKIQASDGLKSPTRAIVLWITLFAAIGALVTLLLSPPWPEAAETTAAPEPPLTAAVAGETCLRLSQNSNEYLSGEAAERRQELRRASCDMAFAAEPDNLHFKVAVARALPHERRAEKLVMLREAAAQAPP